MAPAFTPLSFLFSGACVALVVTYLESHFCTQVLPHVHDLFTHEETLYFEEQQC